jgi:hypothetical protein
MTAIKTTKKNINVTYLMDYDSVLRVALLLLPYAPCLQEPHRGQRAFVLPATNSVN